ncbi:MAG TPA: hypothetical protein PLU64_07870 [Saprospiraceae bacterium]|nr:hypothetical protein [Lewinellaceae bacterium]HQU59097.1 hypothetical protein [Saprospiraceae bacterium]
MKTGYAFRVASCIFLKYFNRSRSISNTNEFQMISEAKPAAPTQKPANRGTDY